MGGFEVGSDGSVNAHRLPGRPAGIGGFANITQSTGRIVFCVNFTAGGLEVAVEDGKLRILREGRVRKFVKAVQSVSFSALNARRSGQRCSMSPRGASSAWGSGGLRSARSRRGSTCAATSSTCSISTPRSQRI